MKYPGVLLRGSIIGIIIGAVPGVGSSVGNLIAYAETKRTAKDSATFGKGNPKGVIAAESAVASAEGGSMATMLALGIPGGGATAILLAAFMMHNIVPGPSFIQNAEADGLRDHPEQHRPGDRAARGRHRLHLRRQQRREGAHALHPAGDPGHRDARHLRGRAARSSGPITLFIFSLIGFALVRYEYPVAAVVVGILLGRMLETEFLRSYQLSGGNPLYILQRPGAMAIVGVMLLSLAMTAWGKRKQAKQEAEEEAAIQALHREELATAGKH